LMFFMGFSLWFSVNVSKYVYANKTYKYI
jgi:hypothetical protein